MERMCALLELQQLPILHVVQELLAQHLSVAQLHLLHLPLVVQLSVSRTGREQAESTHAVLEPPILQMVQTVLCYVKADIRPVQRQLIALLEQQP